jgi:hypothetical protein
MTLAAVGPLSLASIALGLGAIGTLYLLHRLRAEPQRQRVATLIFWREAVGRQRARALAASSFRDPWTFLLLCAIALLAAAAMSAERWVDRAASAARGDVMVIDVGTSMSARADDGKTLLRHAIEAARRDVDSLGATALIAAGGQPSMLSRFDDPAAVLKARLERIAPAATASGSAMALELAASALGTRDGAIYWYTDRDELPAGLPREIIDRVRIRRQPAAADAVAIVGVSFEPSSSDAFRGTLRVSIAGRAAREVTLDAALSDAPLSSEHVTIHDSQVDVLLRDLPADGRIVSLGLRDASGSPAEHVVRYALPRRSPLKFCVPDAAPRPLRAVLAALGTEVASPDGAIVVTNGHQPLPAGAIGSIELLDGNARNGAADAIAAAETAPASVRQLRFEGARATVDLSLPPSASPLLVAGGAVVAAIDIGPAGNRLYLARDLVTESADLPRRAAFPALIFELVSDLAGWTPEPAVVTSLRAINDPLWRNGDATAPPTAVDDAPPITRAADAADIAPPAARRSTNWSWAEVLLASGLALLVVEGLLLAARKIA